jgi:hypothetical protein
MTRLINQHDGVVTSYDESTGHIISIDNRGSLGSRQSTGTFPNFESAKKALEEKMVTWLKV